MDHPFSSLLPLISSFQSPRDLVAFVLRNTPGATVDPDDIRTVQAAMAWWWRFGGDALFEAYLETIPVAPDFVELRRRFPQLNLPLLVDPRLGHVHTAMLVGLEYRENGFRDDSLIPADDRHRMPTDAPYWVLAHDGAPNLGRAPTDCFADCTGDVYAGTADVLMALRLQHGSRRYSMDGPGSVLADGRGSCAYVSPLAAGKSLLMVRSRRAAPRSGAVVFVQG